MANFWRKYWRWIIGIGLVYLYPFYCQLIGMIPGVNWPPLLTFGLYLKDFMTVWIALGGVVAVVVGIFQTQRRITQQESHFNAQTTLQQKQQRDARFASGVELLGNPHESTRIGGAYNLYFLARDYPEYLSPVCEILCAHIRTITNGKDYQEKHGEKPSNEVLTLVDLLLKKYKDGALIFENEYKDFRGAFLHELDLRTTLRKVDFGEADLHHVDFRDSTLDRVNYFGAKLTKVDFTGSELDKVEFYNATLNEVKFIGSKLCENWFEKGAILINVDFWTAKLNTVSFKKAKQLYDVIFKNAELNGIIDFSNIEELNIIDLSSAKRNGNSDIFRGTCLEGYTFEKITHPGYSLELTKPKEENPQ